jgi:hypothetical protein
LPLLSHTRLRVQQIALALTYKVTCSAGEERKLPIAKPCAEAQLHTKHSSMPHASATAIAMKKRLLCSGVGTRGGQSPNPAGEC